MNRLTTTETRQRDRILVAVLVPDDLQSASLPPQRWPVWKVLVSVSESMDCRWFFGEHSVQSDSAEEQVELLIAMGEVLETDLYPSFGEILRARSWESKKWGERGYLFTDAVALPKGIDKVQAALTDSVSLLILPDDPATASQLDLADLVISDPDEDSGEKSSGEIEVLTERFLSEALGTGFGVILLGGDGTQINLHTCSSSQADSFRTIIERLDYD